MCKDAKPAGEVALMTDDRLAALWLSSRDDWRTPVGRYLVGRGFSTARTLRGMFAWRLGAAHPLPGGGGFAEGWAMGTLWAGPGPRNALAVVPRRIYLTPNGRRDSRLERKIVGANRPGGRPIPERWQALLSFLDLLRHKRGEIVDGDVTLKMRESDPLQGVRLVGARGDFAAHTKPGVVHARGGFLSAPKRVVVHVCCDEGVPDHAAKDYMRIARHEFARCGVEEPSLRTLELNRLDALLGELKSRAPRRRDVPVLFMLRDRGDVSQRVLSAMSALDGHGLPWRRAYATDDRQWSVRDQIGSLLHAAGGHPHSVHLAEGNRLPWSIGLDLSHRKRTSRVAACLISPDGRLAGSWACRQERREDIDRKVLRRLLVAAAAEVPSEGRAEGILVVRDGRVFEPEYASEYRRDLGAPVTLVEFRKGGNPPMLLGDDARLPTRPAVRWLPNARGSLGFLVTLPSSGNGFGKVAKIWMRQEWDGMDLGPDRLARILFAQTLTPGLGLHPRQLPAPVYWADGVAGASDGKLGFRGRGIVELDGLPPPPPSPRV